MKSLHSTLVLAFLLALALAGSGCLQAREGAQVTRGPPPVPPRDLARELSAQVQAALDGLDAAASSAARDLGGTGIAGPGAEAILARALSSHPATVAAITYDGNGTVTAAEPARSKSIVGTSLIAQENVRQEVSTQKPLMSEYFALAEGGEAVSIAHPVFSRDGTYLGAVSLTFSPSRLVASFMKKISMHMPVTLAIVEPGGRVLSHTENALVGRNVSDGVFPGWFAGSADLSAPAGCIIRKVTVDNVREVERKEGCWETAGLHGREWRILALAEW